MGLWGNRGGGIAGDQFARAEVRDRKVIEIRRVLIGFEMIVYYICIRYIFSCCVWIIVLLVRILL